MANHLYLVHALSPVHCGTGQAVSGIDLPIARERPTGIPLIPGSSLKGVLRASPLGHDAQGAAVDLHLAAFGPDTSNAAEYAGAVQFSDANLLCLPIRSVRGTFAWVTSPYMLRRLARDVAETGTSWSVPGLEVGDEQCLVTGSRLVLQSGTQKRVVFEDFDFEPKEEPRLAALAKQIGGALHPKDGAAATHFVERVCVVSDDVMHVLLRVGMEVTARNRIDNDTKTVAKGALWTEEALPVESVLVGCLTTYPVARGQGRTRHGNEKLIGHVRSLCAGAVQLGGKATVGRGVCRVEVR